MNPSTRATQAFALYCFCVIVYLTIGGIFQARWGLAGIALNQISFLALPALLYAGFVGLPLKKNISFSQSFSSRDFADFTAYCLHDCHRRTLA